LSAALPHGWPVRQEEDSIASAMLARLAVGAGVVAVAGVAVAGALVVAATGAIRPDIRSLQAPAEIAGVEQTPILVTQAGLDLKEAQRRQLDGWGWADRDAGVATIPIDRAIDLVVQEAAR